MRNILPPHLETEGVRSCASSTLTYILLPATFFIGRFFTISARDFSARTGFVICKTPPDIIAQFDGDICQPFKSASPSNFTDSISIARAVAHAVIARASVTMYFFIQV